MGGVTGAYAAEESFVPATDGSNRFIVEDVVYSLDDQH
jgi:hypothetical protein